MSNELYSYADVYSYANSIAYNNFNNRYNEYSEETRQEESFSDILTTYLKEVVGTKFQDGTKYLDVVKRLGKSIVEHITGNYEIGIGDADYFELMQDSESISNVVAYSDKDSLEAFLENPEELGKGISDGVIANGLIESPDQEKATAAFSRSGNDIKKFFSDALYNITNLNNYIATGIAKLAGMDKEKSNGLNDNLIGKTIGGFAYEFLSGALIAKRHFSDVKNSESMKNLIEQEGILHFTSPANIQKILDSGYIKPSSVLESDVTAKKSFFFAGAPTFEDLLINIPAYNVMTAVRIRPTENQMENLRYRSLNDRAVVQDGKFEFSKEQADIAYFGLMYDEEKKSIYLGEISEEQAKDYVPPKEVTDTYSFGKREGFHPIKNFSDTMKMNTYGLYAEYKHHQKLLQMEKNLREKGITSFRDVNDATLVELSDIEQAYISTKENSVDRQTLFSRIKDRLLTRSNDTKSKEESELENEQLY